MTQIVINGMGRIGRAAFTILLDTVAPVVEVGQISHLERARSGH